MADRSAVLRDAVAPVVESLALDLYDVELAGSGRNRTLRVAVDRPADDPRGVDLDAITAVTEALSPALDRDPAVADVLRGSYTLEVTSPGLERTLREPRHYARVRGSLVSVKVGDGDDARRVRGVLAAVDDDGFELELPDGTREQLAYGDVAQARTVFEWGPQEKPGRARRARDQKVTS